MIIAVLAPAPTHVLAGIANTKHNLINSGRSPLGDASPTEICAFCHTPHTETSEEPLWQKAVPDDQRHFVTYDSFGRSNLNNSRAVGSVSLACLSCHDGTQALNVVNVGPRSAPNTALARESTIDQLAALPTGTPIADHAVSHPVGIPYGGVPVKGETGSALRRAVVASAPALDPNADRPAGFRPVESDVIDEVRVWWLETGNSGRQRTDIHLYSRPVDGGGESEPYVECASCHDPHAESYMFLRTTDPSQPVCLACHDL